MLLDRYYRYYGPYVSVGVVLVILLLIWVFTGRNVEQDFSSINYLLPPRLSITPHPGYLDGTLDVPLIDCTPHSPNAVISRIKPKEKPKRKDSKGELECRATLERIFNKSFNKIRPKWLRNPETNRCLELDCYNEELKLALEYNGIQHYVWPNYTTQPLEAFLQQVRRDKFKREKCDSQGVYLITVPYNYTEKHNSIEQYIIKHLPDNLKAF